MPAPSQVTVDEVANWLGLNQRTDPINKMLDRCLTAAVEHIAARLGSWVPEPWPGHVEDAVVLLSARLYKRKNSPEGVSGFGDLGVIRVTGIDPDVDALLGTDLAYHIGGALPVVSP